MAHTVLYASAVDGIIGDIKARMREEQLVYLAEDETDTDNDVGSRQAVKNLNRVLSRAIGFVSKTFGEGKLCVLAPIAIETEQNVLLIIPEDLAERSRDRTGAIVVPITKASIIRAIPTR
jgi:hypothetical protein